jgi:hypothetical protein
LIGKGKGVRETVSSHVRLGILLFGTATVLMWWMGDFNLYIGSGDDREFKSFPTQTERVLGSIGVGFAYAVASSLVFSILECIWAGRQKTGKEESGIPTSEEKD